MVIVLSVSSLTSLKVSARKVILTVGLTATVVTAIVTIAPAALAAPAASVASHPVIAQHELEMLNKERAAHHLPALRMNADLINSAYHHNLQMSSHNSMSHQLPGEKSLGDRILAAHYDWCTAGENVGWTTDMTAPGARELESMMYNEKAPNDGHRRIILSSGFRDIGISVVTDTAHNKLWLTEDFGHVC